MATALMSELDKLVSEGRNPGTMTIDTMSINDILTTISGGAAEAAADGFLRRANAGEA